MKLPRPSLTPLSTPHTTPKTGTFVPKIGTNAPQTESQEKEKQARSPRKHPRKALLGLAAAGERRTVAKLVQPSLTPPVNPHNPQKSPPQNPVLPRKHAEPAPSRTPHHQKPHTPKTPKNPPTSYLSAACPHSPRTTKTPEFRGKTALQHPVRKKRPRGPPSYVREKYISPPAPIYISLSLTDHLNRQTERTGPYSPVITRENLSASSADKPRTSRTSPKNGSKAEIELAASRRCPTGAA